VTAVRFRFIQQPSHVRAYLSSLASHHTFAIDLEADSLYSYPEKLCLVQLSTPAENVILDPLRAGDSLQGLWEALADGSIQKILHGGDYDVRLLKKEFGIELHNVVDTMIASQLAGHQRVGLADLLQEELCVHLDKRFQRANWSRRPLPEDMLRYAALDTAYLLPLWQRLRDQLSQLGRLHWAQEEFELLEQVSPPAEQPPSCFDVKGAHKLSPRQRAVLQALVELRERVAWAWGRPPFKVLGNQVLLKWAQSPPANHQDILETRAANRGTLRRLASEILAAVSSAKSKPVRDCPQRHHASRPPLTSKQNRLLRSLKKARQTAAQRLGLHVGLLVNTRTLETLARVEPAQAADELQSHLKRWQLEALGVQLLRVLQEQS